MYKEQIGDGLHGFFSASESYRMTNSCNTDLQIWTLSGDPGTSILNSIYLHSNTLSFSINHFINGSNNLFLIFVSVILVFVIIIVLFVFFFSFFSLRPLFFLFLVYSFSFLLLISFLLNSEK